MEDVLEIYQGVYTPEFPVVCMNKSNKQIGADIILPAVCAPGKPQKLMMSTSAKVWQIFLLRFSP